MNTGHVVALDGEIKDILLSSIPDDAWSFVKKKYKARGHGWWGWRTPSYRKVEVFVVQYEPKDEEFKTGAVILLGPSPNEVFLTDDPVELRDYLMEEYRYERNVSVVIAPIDSTMCEDDE